MDLSIIVPMKDEQDNVRPLHKAICQALEPTGYSFEMILVDDGIATGTTMISSIALIRKSKPKSIIVAVPVAPPDTAKKVSSLADQFICPYTPSDFMGVGQFYQDFRQIEDEEVVEMMKG